MQTWSSRRHSIQQDSSLSHLIILEITINETHVVVVRVAIHARPAMPAHIANKLTQRTHMIVIIRA